MRTIHLYPDTAPEKLGFDRILELIDKHCLGDLGRRFLGKLRISTDVDFIRRALMQVHEMKGLLTADNSFPTGHYHDLGEELSYLEIKNSVLTEEQFVLLIQFLVTIEDIFRFFGKRTGEFPQLEALLKGEKYEAAPLRAMQKVLTEDGQVRPGVSPELDKIRRELKGKERELDKAFNAMMSQAAKEGWLAAGSESLKNGRRVLMVLTEHKRRIKGVIHDESATGKTIFLEPEVTLEINNELFELQQEERREIYRILKELSDRIHPFAGQMRAYQQLAGLYDFIRAKALVAGMMKAELPEITESPEVNLLNAYHPLLLLHNKKVGKNTIPVSLKLDGRERILLISGPNAGGKSVTLKTVGLLQMMVQAGMLVPASPDSRFGIFQRLFVELGDEQSIENELSTYSSRLMHMKYFLQKADGHMLFFIDEFGTGTDPKFGGAMAEAMLEELNRKGAFGVINTHYSNLKIFASNTPGIQNGAMLFDKEHLSSLYELRVGQPGSSHAMEIAQKIGLPKNVLNGARRRLDESLQEVDSLLSNLQTDKHMSEVQRKRLTEEEARLEGLIATYRTLKEELEKSKRQILFDAKQKAMEGVEKSKRRFDDLLKEYKKQDRDKALETKIQEAIIAEKRELAGEIQVIRQEVRANKAPVEIVVGSRVKLLEGKEVGTVESLRSGRALVEFGNLRTLVSVNELEPVTNEKKAKPSARTTVDYAAAGQGFQHTLDVRGLSAAEALEEIDRQLDKAMLLSIFSFRILHGHGDGILRRRIRERLKGYKFIRSFHSEHIEQGGDAFTVVELE